MVWIISRNLCEVTRWCECFSQRWYGAYKEWKKRGAGLWTNINLMLKYNTLNTLTHTKNTVIFYNFCLFHSVCVCWFFYSILTIWQICVRSVMQQQTQWDIHFFLKKGNVIIRKCIEFVNKKGWTWRAREEQKKNVSSGEQKGHKNNDMDNVKKILNDSKTHLFHYVERLKRLWVPNKNTIFTHCQIVRVICRCVQYSFFVIQLFGRPHISDPDQCQAKLHTPNQNVAYHFWCSCFSFCGSHYYIVLF